MYALVGAHLAQLLLNWQNDSFVMRQRMGIGIIGMGDDAIEQKPPAVLPKFYLRWWRLIFALLVLCLTLKPLDHESIDDISHKTHLFGALSGVLSGFIFLKMRNRQVTTQMNYMRNSLKYAFWFLISYVIVRFISIQFKVAKGFENDQNYCPLSEYECICQSQCYPTPSVQLPACNFTISVSLQKNCSFNLNCTDPFFTQSAC